MEAIFDVRPPATAPVSRRARWAGRILTAVPALFLVFDAAMKLARVQPVVDAFARMGMPDRLAPAIGALELVCVAIYLTPAIATIGAVLLSAYLGGAIASHVRIEDPLLSHTLFPIYIAAFLWAGLYLRDPRVRAFIAANR
jgi:DoxX-like family